MKFEYKVWFRLYNIGLHKNRKKWKKCYLIHRDEWLFCDIKNTQIKKK